MGEGVAPPSLRRSLFCLACLFTVADSLVTSVSPADNRRGFAVFRAALQDPDEPPPWTYDLRVSDDGHVFGIDRHSGDVTLQNSVACGSVLQNPVPVTVRARRPCCSTEWTIWVRFPECVVTDSLPDTADTVRVTLHQVQDACFVRSEPIVRLASLLPRFGNCSLSYGHPSTSQCCAIERVGGDLVAHKDFCGPVADTVTTRLTSSCGNLSYDLTVAFGRHRTKRHTLHFEKSLHCFGAGG